MKKLKRVQLMISITPKVSITLAIIACIFYIINMKASAYIVIGAIVILLITYFILSLTSWRCPFCHQYLPTKNAGKITKCPACQKLIFEDKKSDGHHH